MLLFSHKYTIILRGIAIILVMLSHIMGNWTRLFTPCGGIGVAIFLFISGYGLNESYKKNGLNHYWVKKIIRVFIPYCIIETIVFLILDNDYSWNDYLLDIFGIITHLWYIGFLLKQYILFYIFTRWLYKYRNPCLLFASVIVLVSFPSIEAEQAFSFYIGYIFSDKINIIQNTSDNKFTTYAFIFLAIGIVFLAMKQLPIIRLYSEDYIYNIIQCMIKLPVGLFLIFTMRYLKNPVINNAVFFIGSISYEIYLIHMYLIGYIKQDFIRATFVIIISLILSTIFNSINKQIAKNLKTRYNIV